MAIVSAHGVEYVLQRAVLSAAGESNHPNIVQRDIGQQFVHPKRSLCKFLRISAHSNGDLTPHRRSLLYNC